MSGRAKAVLAVLAVLFYILLVVIGDVIGKTGTAAFLAACVIGGLFEWAQWWDHHVGSKQ